MSVTLSRRGFLWRTAVSGAGAASGVMLSSAALAGAGGVSQLRSEAGGHEQAHSLLNVSYDPTRGLYADISRAFVAGWEKTAPSGDALVVRTSNGGSGAQARSVLEGVPADIVSLGLSRDIDLLTQYGLISADWRTRLPHGAVPYTSTIVFLVRRGNPLGIHDWPDLVRPGVRVVTPNPRTSGGARWNYMAAWGAALRRSGGSEAAARAYMQALFRHVPVLDTGARGATNTFVQRGFGDVLLAWENEALLASLQLAPGHFEIIVPSLSILAEPPVAVVDRNVERHGTRAVAEAYLRYLFTPEGQTIGARHYFRPVDAACLAANREHFTDVPLFDIASLGGWGAAQKKHFVSGGLFDQITAG